MERRKKADRGNAARARARRQGAGSTLGRLARVVSLPAAVLVAPGISTGTTCFHDPSLVVTSILPSNSWEEEMFGHLDADPLEDPDGDGISNIHEYRLRSPPTVPSRKVPPEVLGLRITGVNR